MVVAEVEALIAFNKIIRDLDQSLEQAVADNFQEVLYIENLDAIIVVEII